MEFVIWKHRSPLNHIDSLICQIWMPQAGRRNGHIDLLTFFSFSEKNKRKEKGSSDTWCAQEEKKTWHVLIIIFCVIVFIAVIFLFAEIVFIAFAVESTRWRSRSIPIFRCLSLCLSVCRSACHIYHCIFQPKGSLKGLLLRGDCRDITCRIPWQCFQTAQHEIHSSLFFSVCFSFLVELTRLYDPLCPIVCLSVCPSLMLSFPLLFFIASHHF